MDGPLYGASLTGVTAIVPMLEIGDDTVPSEADVAGFLEAVSGWVDASLGDLTLVDEARRDRTIAGAKGVVELGAAAMAEDAAHPENAGPTSSSYGTRLWERYDKALEALLDSIGRGAEGAAGGAGAGVAGTALVRAPAPLWRRNRGF